MKVLFVNPIIYTPENARIPKVKNIDDTMSYDLCTAFQRHGVDITLAAAEEWKPTEESDFPFPILWMKSSWKRIFPIHRIPVNWGLIRYLRTHHFDMIITSEVFSVDTLLCALFARKQTVIWHEMAKHNRMGAGMLSRLWYGVVPRLFMRHVPVVARSERARHFIAQYCSRVCDTVIEHGVDLKVFPAERKKADTFCVVSQLIQRKRIDLTIQAFARYLETYDSHCELNIIGDGEERESLECLVQQLGIERSVVFTGQLDHQALQRYLCEAKAMLVSTEKDNSMISIVESIASATPVVTTSIPLNASYIKSERLGIVKDGWDATELAQVDKYLDEFVENCMRYRESMSTDHKVEQFLEIYRREVVK